MLDQLSLKKSFFIDDTTVFVRIMTAECCERKDVVSLAETMAAWADRKLLDVRTWLTQNEAGSVVVVYEMRDESSAILMLTVELESEDQALAFRLRWL
jgi:hypothetical protein